MSDIIDSGGLYPFTERLSDAQACIVCGELTLSVEDQGETSFSGRMIRRIACACGQHGPWSTAPVQAWNRGQV